MSNIYTKTLTLTAVVTADSPEDAGYWLGKEFRKLLGQFENYGDLAPVERLKDLPEGYGPEDSPDNDDELTLRQHIEPSGIEGMRRSLEDS